MFLVALCWSAVAGAQELVDVKLVAPWERPARVGCVLYDDADAVGARMMTATQEEAPMRSFGSPEVIVCLAEFSDTKYSIVNDVLPTHVDTLAAVRDSFEVFFIGSDGQHAGRNAHSVTEYFAAMSEGQFTPHFNIISGITLPNTQKYYSTSSGSGRRSTFRDDVLKLLSPMIKSRIDDYDANKDGKVDGVIIVYPGYGNNVVTDGTNMHACCWPSGHSTGGVAYATELIAPELYSNKNNDINSIGVYVHEMSHMLGLPDFYDAKSPMTASGMDYWSLMDYGEYWMDGYIPTPYTAYERMFMGWRQPIELNEPVTITDMRSIGEGGDAYIIYNDANRDEYYILENLSSGWEWSKSICNSLGNGLIVYHVDYSASAWSSTTVNNVDNHQRMTIVPANGHFELCNNFLDDITEGSKKWVSELRGHLYPLKYNVSSVIEYWGMTTGNDELTDSVRSAADRVAPAATLYNANTDGVKLMHKPITEIKYFNSDRTCSFKFMGGTPTGISDVEADSEADRRGLYIYQGRLVIMKDGKRYNLSGQTVR